MSPPPAATHTAPTSLKFATSSASELDVAAPLARLLDQRPWGRLRFALDVIVLYLAAGAALFASPMASTAANRWLAGSFPLITIAILQLRPGSDRRLNGSIVDIVAHVLGAISLSAMLMIAIESFVGSPHPIQLALRLWLFGAVYVAGARLALLLIRRQAIKSEALSTPTLIVGAGQVGEHIAKRLSGEPRYGLRPVGYLDADPMPVAGRSTVRSVPVLGRPNDLHAALASSGARHVIVAFTSEPDRALVERIRECEQLGVTVSLVPRFYEAINERATLDYVGGMPLLTVQPVDPRGWRFQVKHACDRAFALIALIAIAPVLLAIAIAVRVGSPGPILFRQRRVGRDGHPFDLLKFRTMREPAATEGGFELREGCAPGGVEGEDRRTAVGRFLRDTSLDELPQFINVLRGDMSLVGPRPERPEYVEVFAREVSRYEDRHRVKSGITGWAQVNGLRGQTSIDDRVEWDNYYIENWSLWLDVRIIVMTTAEVLRFRDSATNVPSAGRKH